MRRGIEVSRVDEHAPVATGLAWQTRFSLRGRLRDLRLVLTQLRQPDSLALAFDSKGLDGTVEIDLLALSPRRTRLALALTLEPKTLSARLFVQSLKLARNNLTRKFRLRLAEYAKELEDRLNRKTKGA